MTKEDRGKLRTLLNSAPTDFVMGYVEELLEKYCKRAYSTGHDEGYEDAGDDLKKGISL